MFETEVAYLEFPFPPIRVCSHSGWHISVTSSTISQAKSLGAQPAERRENRRQPISAVLRSGRLRTATTSPKSHSTGKHGPAHVLTAKIVVSPEPPTAEGWCRWAPQPGSLYPKLRRLRVCSFSEQPSFRSARGTFSLTRFLSKPSFCTVRHRPIPQLLRINTYSK